MTRDDPFECVVVGGGAAGLSGALVLGRARRRVLLLDDGRQSNRPAHGVGGLLGHDGTPPDELYALARRQLEPYTSVVVREATAERAEADGEAFRVTLTGGETVAARRLLLATGMDYTAPAVEGLRELWGDTVFHCPFCHGWEVRDRPLAVLGSSPPSAFAATLLTGWSADVVLLTDGPAALEDAARAGLASAGVQVDERRVERLEAEGGRLRAVRFADGSALERDGLLVQAPLLPRSPLPGQLGLELTEAGAVKVDERGATSLEGVFAAGDGAGQMAQVSRAVASGALAGAMIAHELITEPHGMPFPGPPAPAAAAAAGAR
jgi:thioredoxin reductase